MTTIHDLGATLQRLIKDMERGEEGYTVPWALAVAPDGRCYINTRFSIHAAPRGTVQMKVRCTRYGYQATPPPDYQYHVTRESEIGHEHQPILGMVV